jgi:hypothetical protein
MGNATGVSPCHLLTIHAQKIHMLALIRWQVHTLSVPKAANF